MALDRLRLQRDLLMDERAGAEAALTAAVAALAPHEDRFWRFHRELVDLHKRRDKGEEVTSADILAACDLRMHAGVRRHPFAKPAGISATGSRPSTASCPR
jgi:hypothetical protein